MPKVHIYTKCQPLLAPYILKNLMIHQNHYYEKNSLTTKIWHQTNTLTLFWCKINWLSTICISDQHIVGIWQKCVAVIIKNQENTKKAHLFDEISEINHNYWHILKGELFLYICGKNCIQGANLLGAPAQLRSPNNAQSSEKIEPIYHLIGHKFSQFQALSDHFVAYCRPAYCRNLAKMCDCNSQKSRKYKKTTFIWWNIKIKHKFLTYSERWTFFCIWVVKIVFKMQIYLVHHLNSGVNNAQSLDMIEHIYHLIGHNFSQFQALSSHFVNKKSKII